MSEKTVKLIRETVTKYNDLLAILAANEDEDNVCRLSKKKISTLYGLSYTGTLKKLNFLMQHGIIEKVSGGFKRTGKDVYLHTPISLIIDIMVLVKEKPEIYSSFKQQAELLSVPIEDVRSAWGFQAYFFGSKYADID